MPYIETKNTLSWVILAGGQASRMGGNDKGLLLLDHTPLIEWIFNTLRPQVSSIRINANRNQDKYEHYAPVHTDHITGFQGPLAGIHASLISSSTEWVGFTPCDTPNLPSDLVRRLSKELDSNIDIYVAHDGQFPQPVFSLWNRNALPKLEAFLKEGDRKMKKLLKKCKTQYVDFSDIPETFINLNTPEELNHFNRLNHINHSKR